MSADIPCKAALGLPNVAALPGTGNAGDLVFLTTDKKIYWWSGSTWLAVGQSGAGGPTVKARVNFVALAWVLQAGSTGVASVATDADTTSCDLTLSVTKADMMFFITPICTAGVNSQGPNVAVKSFDGTVAVISSYLPALATSVDFWVIGFSLS